MLQDWQQVHFLCGKCFVDRDFTEHGKPNHVLPLYSSQGQIRTWGSMFEFLKELMDKKY